MDLTLFLFNETNNRCGIYQLTCPSCNRKYIGQTDRPFRIRFQEHFLDYKYMNNRSKFAHNLLENEHHIVPMENIMDILYTISKEECYTPYRNSTFT
jgi:hypothetical protein